ncbi:MAG: ABC transporter substrate-binding protein [Bacteroidaceae bacterium]|nr:ABC transporter substrate-binding protein [Bacteroidaceae bacterium]
MAFPKKYIVVSVLLLVAAASIIAAGMSRRERYTLYNIWTAQAQFAGYMYADKEGLFREEGLDVEVLYDDSVHSCAQMLESGRAQFVVMDMLNALLARQNGLKIVNVMQTSQTMSHCIVTRDSVHSIEDLRGKEIVIWHGYNPVLMKAIDAKTDSTVKWTEVFSGVEAFREGGFDNIICTSYNEILQLEEMGCNPSSFNKVYYSEMGINTPEDGVYVTEEFYRSHPDVVKRFVRAATNGWHGAYRNKARALEIVMQEMERHNLPHSAYHEMRMLNELERLQSVDGKVPRKFNLNKRNFEDAERMYRLYSGKGAPIAYDEFVVNPLIGE